MGHEWKKWFPFVGAIFFFILISNLMGLIPGLGGATTDVNVAGAWAIISFALYHYVGIREHGFGLPDQVHWARASHLLGASIYIADRLLFLLETVLARMVTLTIRLIANMFADHTVVGVCSWLVPIGVPAIFIGLGILVCVLQAFVFSLLTMIYIGLALQRPTRRRRSGDRAISTQGEKSMKKFVKVSLWTLAHGPRSRTAAAGRRRGGAARARAALGAGIAIGLAGLGCGIGQGLTAGNTTAGIARNPGAAGAMFVNYILGMVLIESIAIYGLVIAFLLQAKIG